MEQVPNWECLFVHRKQGCFLSVHVDDIKMAWTKENMAPMWKKLMKHSDLDEPTSFLDHVYLGCIQRECKSNVTILEQFSKMFESRISVGATEKLQGCKNVTQRRSHGLTTWKDMLKTASKGIVNWQRRRKSNYTKFQLHAWMITTSRRRSWKRCDNWTNMLTDNLEKLVLGTKL